MIIKKYNYLEILTDKERPFSVYNTGALAAELAKDYKTAQDFYRLAGEVRKSYEMGKLHKIILEKDKKNKELSDKFKQKILK